MWSQIESRADCRWNSEGWQILIVRPRYHGVFAPHGRRRAAV